MSTQQQQRQKQQQEQKEKLSTFSEEFNLLNIDALTDRSDRQILDMMVTNIRMTCNEMELDLHKVIDEAQAVKAEKAITPQEHLSPSQQAA